MNYQSMRKLSKQFRNVIFTCALFTCMLQYSCKTVEKNGSSTVLTVKKIKKYKNGVYVIHASRNDSIFKIVSLYDERAAKKQLLVKGMKFDVPIVTMHDVLEKALGVTIMKKLGVVEVFRGVEVPPDPGKVDVWICENEGDLNGPFLTR